MENLMQWCAGQRAIVSIDTDFFMRPEEIGRAAEFETWLLKAAASGVPLVLRENHVDLVALIDEPVDVIVNFDWHMDLRLEFLFGHPPLRPPQDASVFETVISSGLTQRYVWAHPVSRRSEAARVYCAAINAGRQPLLGRIHCVPGSAVLEQLLGVIEPVSVFICRSPAYATAASNAVYRQLDSAVTAAIMSTR